MDRRDSWDRRGRRDQQLADLIAALSTEDMEKLIAAPEKRRVEEGDHDIEEVDGPRVRRVKLRVRLRNLVWQGLPPRRLRGHLRLLQAHLRADRSFRIPNMQPRDIEAGRSVEAG